MSDIQMKIYNHAPIFIQNAFTSVQGFRYKKQRYGQHYHLYLEELKGRDYSNKLAQKELQDKLFVQFVQYAFKNSLFYKEFYSSLDLNEIKSTEDIIKLPVLDKETVRSNLDKLYTILPQDGVISNTSGTTGTSMKFIYTNEDMQKRMAYLDYFKFKHGFISGEMKRASFSSPKIVPPKQKSKVYWRDNLTIKQRLYSGYHCKGENLKYYIKDLNKYKPASIDGYPSALFELAQYIIDEKITLNFSPIAIFPTAETLLPHYRKIIEKAFNCPVRNQYASSEGAPFITECECGNLHYNMDTGIIEVAENGEMLVTCFETHGTPLIRYKIGDRVIMEDSKRICECGSSHPIVKEIEGRGIDYLNSPSNGRFTAIYLSLVSQEFLNSVKKMKFIQNRIDEVDILLEVDNSYKNEMNKIIIDKLHYSLGNDMQFNIKIVDDIPKEPSGKYRLIENNII